MATRLSRQSQPRCFRINHLALALALLSIRAEDATPGWSLFRSAPEWRCFRACRFSAPGKHAVTYRIERSTTRRGVTFFLSGEMDSRHVADLGVLMAAESSHNSLLDLAEVTLVNREAMEFLARMEAAGAVLVNCPEYVRSWIDAEQGNA
jgi:hypothetical protein